MHKAYKKIMSKTYEMADKFDEGAKDIIAVYRQRYLCEREKKTTVNTLCTGGAQET